MFDVRRYQSPVQVFLCQVRMSKYFYPAANRCVAGAEFVSESRQKFVFAAVCILQSLFRQLAFGDVLKGYENAVNLIFRE